MSAAWASSDPKCKNPSPVDLSESEAGKCEALCEWSMNDSFPSLLRMIPETNPVVSMEAADSTISSTWNGQNATLQSATIFHPAQHTVDGTRYDGEFVMTFQTTAGKLLYVSVLLQTSAKETPSAAFFHTWIPYANQMDTPIKLQEGMSFSHALPADGGYYVYSGSGIFGPCTPATWVVHKRPVSIFANDIASLNTVAPAGYRAAAPLGKRKVYFNDRATTKISEETLQSNDDRVYIRCTPLGDDPISIGPPIVPLSNSMESKLEASIPSLTPMQIGKLIGAGLLFAVTGAAGLNGGTSIASLLYALVPV